MCEIVYIVSISILRVAFLTACGVKIHKLFVLRESIASKLLVHLSAEQINKLWVYTDDMHLQNGGKFKTVTNQ